MHPIVNTYIHIYLFIYLLGCTVLVGLGPLVVQVSRSHSVGLHLTGDRPHDTHRRQNIHATGGIRSRNPSKRAAADPRLRPRGHRHRQMRIFIPVPKPIVFV